MAASTSSATRRLRRAFAFGTLPPSGLDDVPAPPPGRPSGRLRAPELPRQPRHEPLPVGRRGRPPAAAAGRPVPAAPCPTRRSCTTAPRSGPIAGPRRALRRWQRPSRGVAPADALGRRPGPRPAGDVPAAHRRAPRRRVAVARRARDARRSTTSAGSYAVRLRDGERTRGRRPQPGGDAAVAGAAGARRAWPSSRPPTRRSADDGPTRRARAVRGRHPRQGTRCGDGRRMTGRGARPAQGR